MERRRLGGDLTEILNPHPAPSTRFNETLRAMKTICALSLLAFVACSHGGGSPYAAATGIARTGANDRSARVLPLTPMTGDVEILYGDPEKVGEPFVMRIRELPGTMVPLHQHPVDEHITVVSGSWWFAVGNEWDRSALKEIRAGGYAFAPSGATMYAWSPDGAVVQVHGIGPFHIHWLHGSKTLDDADAASTFTFRRGDAVDTPRGAGKVRNGYASGEIIQYEVDGTDGT